MTGEQWHYVKNGRSHGPITSQELKELAAAGSLMPNDLVWTEGQDEWKPAQSIEGLLSENQSNSAENLPPIIGYTPAASAIRKQSKDIVKKFFSTTLSDSVARLIQKVAWLICGGVIVLGSCLFVIMEASADSAIQEAAGGAIFCTVFIGAYVLARAIEKFTNL